MLLPPSSWRFTGDERRLRAREVHRGERDVVGLAEAREVHALVARRRARDDVGVATVVDHVPGADRVAADAVVGVVDGDRSGEGVDAALARDVRGEPGLPARPAGRDVDDRAVPAASRCGSAARVNHIGAVRFTRRIASHASVVRSPARLADGHRPPRCSRAR